MGVEKADPAPQQKFWIEKTVAHVIVAITLRELFNPTMPTTSSDNSFVNISLLERKKRRQNWINAPPALFMIPLKVLYTRFIVNLSSYADKTV